MLFFICIAAVAFSNFAVTNAFQVLIICMIVKVSNELSGKTYDHQSRSANNYEMMNHKNSN